MTQVTIVLNEAEVHTLLRELDALGIEGMPALSSLKFILEMCGLGDKEDANGKHD